MGDEAMSKGNDSSQIRDSEVLSDDDRIREQFYPDDTDDPLLAAILAPPAEFCSQSRDIVSGDVTGKTTEISRRHVSIYAVHQKLSRRLNLQFKNIYHISLFYCDKIRLKDKRPAV